MRKRIMRVVIATAIATGAVLAGSSAAFAGFGQDGYTPPNDGSTCQTNGGGGVGSGPGVDGSSATGGGSNDTNGGNNINNPQPICQ